MPVFKSKGAEGGWINGQWHPNGAEAAMTGTALPVEAPKADEPKAKAPASAPAAPAKVGDKK